MDVFMFSFLSCKPQIHIDKSISIGCRFEDLEATELAGFLQRFEASHSQPSLAEGVSGNGVPQGSS